MESTGCYRPTKAIINLEAIKENVKSVKRHVGKGTSVIAVVKADGYGHGDVEVARATIEAGVEMVAVATAEEALRLRRAGIRTAILVLTPSPVSFVEKAARLDITLAVSEADWLEKVLAQEVAFQNPLKIHIKVDCGMGRTGLRNEKELQNLMEVVANTDCVIVDGMFMQFSCADELDRRPTEQQFDRFMQLANTLKEKPRLLHASNSAGTFLYPEFALDAVRVGIGLYGIAPSGYVDKKLPFPLKKALSLETELSFVKLLENGSPISYGSTYKTSGEEWIGTIPIGYADGLRRGLRGQEVLVGGQRAPIVGTICMDQCMVKLPKEMKVGEKVTLIGKQGDEEIPVEEWATRLDTIPYEIPVLLTARVPRVYPALTGRPT